MKQLFAFGALVLAGLLAVHIIISSQILNVRRDKYLLDHKCRLVNQVGEEADHLYECDTGLMRMRDIG